ncbi:hypothetical protein Zmor_014968 [Zophobas morio]|uniref:Uncharacterized protein n=1 Tax=Zophobas morio TaxID=2755281 RepID=A0AA38IDH0_9CUCU|nr:hypothetical protein Zmor_014968 [Zophobas morio]
MRPAMDSNRFSRESGASQSTGSLCLSPLPFLRKTLTGAPFDRALPDINRRTSRSDLSPPGINRRIYRSTLLPPDLNRSIFFPPPHP